MMQWDEKDIAQHRYTKNERDCFWDKVWAKIWS